MQNSPRVAEFFCYNLFMKKGFSSLIIISITAVSILFVSGGSYYFIQSSKEEIPKMSPQQEIENFVLENIKGEDKKTTHVSDRFVRGEVLIDGLINNFYMIKVGEDWNIFGLSNQPISCEKAEKIGFPASMISDCIYKSPNANTSGDVNKKSKEYLLSEGKIEIIGDISIGSDPSSGFQIIDEDGNSVNINVGNFDPSGFDNLGEGDYVIIDVSVSENSDGEIQFNLDSVEDVNANSDDETENISASRISNSSNNTTDNSTTGNALNDSDLSEEIYYDITDLPPGYTPDLDAYYKSLIDRDFSDNEVEIISDF